MKLSLILSRIEYMIIDKLKLRKKHNELDKRNKELLSFITSTNPNTTIAKRLDEHREIVDKIINNSNLLMEYNYIISWAKSNDDYLVAIYQLVYGYEPKPDKEERYRERVVFMPRPNYENF
ncbi:hypothetical protein QMU85_002785 [Photobacterium damselae]|nr:hypothetical protein [Photobacterium damselae]